MATPKRPWFPGATYHITNRGTRGEVIFLEDMDFTIYLRIIKETLKFYKDLNYKIISYCLMSNHIHLLLKTDTHDPSHFMRRLNSLYAKYYNNKYNFQGHLFQDRYFSNIITSDFELLEVSKYIHLNPVKAKIVDKVEDYKWSSYRKIVSTQIESEKSPYIHCNEILDIIDIYLIVDEHNSKGVKSKSKLHKKIADKKLKYKKYVDNSLFSPEA